MVCADTSHIRKPGSCYEEMVTAVKELITSILLLRDELTMRTTITFMPPCHHNNCHFNEMVYFISNFLTRWSPDLIEVQRSEVLVFKET